MLSFTVRRAAFAIIMMLGISIAIYLLFTALPVDPAALTCGQRCTPEKIAVNRHQLGYDLPILDQYWQFLRGTVAGRTYGEGSVAFTCPAPSLGYSFKEKECVTTLVADSLPVSVAVALGAFVVWMLAGVGLGVRAARSNGRSFDRVVTAASVVALSMPTFFLSLLMVFVVVIWAGLMEFPRYQPLTVDPWTWFRSMLMPWVTVAIVTAPAYIRITRFGVLDTASEDFVRLGAAIGLPRRTVVRRYVLRALALPIATMAAIDLGLTLGGTVFVEKIFSLPGMGRLAIDAATDFDLPVLVGTSLVAALFVVLFNFVIDVACGLIDPRVRVR